LIRQQAVNKSNMVSRDVVYSILVIGYVESCLYRVISYPHLLVIQKDDQMVDLINSIIKIDEKRTLLSYDTTFNLGIFAFQKFLNLYYLLN
jgi:hypothetical protein